MFRKWCEVKLIRSCLVIWINYNVASYNTLEFVLIGLCCSTEVLNTVQQRRNLSNFGGDCRCPFGTSSTNWGKRLDNAMEDDLRKTTQRMRRWDICMTIMWLCGGSAEEKADGVIGRRGFPSSPITQSAISHLHIYLYSLRASWSVMINFVHVPMPFF